MCICNQVRRGPVVSIYLSLIEASFLSTNSILGRRHAVELRPLSDLKEAGRQWAMRAGREALMTIDQPTLAGAQTCQVLALYWFSQGDSRRNTMFSGIAYRAVRTILFDPTSGVNHTNVPRWQDVETIRRCFWAGWVTNVVNSDHYVVGSSSDIRALNLPLPISDHAYYNGIDEPATTLASPPSSHESTPNAVAETLRVLQLW